MEKDVVEELLSNSGTVRLDVLCKREGLSSSYAPVIALGLVEDLALE